MIDDIETLLTQLVEAVQEASLDNLAGSKEDTDRAWAKVEQLKQAILAASSC